MIEGFNLHLWLCYAFVLSCCWVMFWMPRWIRCQAKWGGQVVRDNGPETHHVKRGTPTMGGVVVISAIMIAGLLWADLWHDVGARAMVLALGLFAGIGFSDDWLKARKGSSDGLSARAKFLLQTIASLMIAWVLYPLHMHHHVLVPFMPHLSFDLGVWFVPWCWLVIVGGSNAVNLTDGLDGLATFPLIAVMLGMMVVLMIGHTLPVSPSGLHAFYIIGAACVGACLAFLWFNCLPASIFMGDVGSLALGALVSTFALHAHLVLFLAIMGFVFLVEMISVALQVSSFKLRKKRLFKMAPIHHHFELLGWTESKVIVRFWIVAFFLKQRHLYCGMGGKAYARICNELVRV